MHEFYIEMDVHASVWVIVTGILFSDLDAVIAMRANKISHRQEKDKLSIRRGTDTKEPKGRFAVSARSVFSILQITSYIYLTKYNLCFFLSR